MDRRAVAEGTVSARGPPAAAERRGGDDAGLAFQRDQRGEDRDAADEVLRGVDGVEDPTPPRAAARTEFLADDRVIRPRARQALREQPLDAFVDLRHRRPVDVEVNIAGAPTVTIASAYYYHAPLTTDQLRL